MLKLVNSEGNELLRLNDDGTEEIKDKKLKEQMEQGKKLSEKDGK